MNFLKNPCSRWLILSLALGLPGIADADSGSQQPLDLPQLMALMAQVTSRHDRFTETKTLSMLTKPLTLTGTLAYSSPDRVEKHVLTPYEEHLIVEGEQLTLVTKDGTKRVKVKSHPLIWSFVEAIRASLAGEVTALRRFYHVKLEGTRDKWILTLRPLNPEAAGYLTSITLSGHGDRLGSVDIRETGGDRSVMTIHEPAS
jgi:outer membrane lipoprotein-sorting protein